MKTTFTSQLKEGDQLEDEPFLLQDIYQGTTRRGDPFLRITLVDSKGQVNGIFWNVPANVLEWARAGLVALVDGRVSTYREALQVVINSLTLHETPNIGDFLPTADRNEDEMIAELRQIIQTLASPYRELCEALLLDPSFLPRFATAPAAKRMHHAYVGGLLSHVLSMVGTANHLAGHYSGVNRDLLVTGVLLHDIGKVMEYDTEAGITITDDGQLVGHIVRGIVLIEQTAAELPDFPPTLLREVVHLVASHHGTQEWGSPVTPKTLEAVMLHYLDLLDSRVQGFLDFLAHEGDEQAWSQNISPMFGTYLRRSHPGDALE